MLCSLNGTSAYPVVMGSLKMLSQERYACMMLIQRQHCNSAACASHGCVNMLVVHVYCSVPQWETILALADLCGEAALDLFYCLLGAPGPSPVPSRPHFHSGLLCAGSGPKGRLWRPADRYSKVVPCPLLHIDIRRLSLLLPGLLPC